MDPRNRGRNASIQPGKQRKATRSAPTSSWNYVSAQVLSPTCASTTPPAHRKKRRVGWPIAMRMQTVNRGSGALPTVTRNRTGCICGESAMRSGVTGRVGHTDADGYVERLRPIVAAMRAVDPTIKIVAVGDTVSADANPASLPVE